MRYLRMLSNSVLAGCFATAYVVVLIFQLNPTLRLTGTALWPLVTHVGLFYVVHLTVMSYALLAFRQLLAREVFSPAWVSVGVLTWLAALAAAGAAVLMWANLITYSLVLDAATVRAMVRGAATLAAASTCFLLLAVLRRKTAELRWLQAVSLLAVGVVSIGALVAERGGGTLPPLQARPIETLSEGEGAVEPAPRVHVIAIDAGSLDFISSATAEGRLPNFGRVLDAGAVMHVATIHPTSAEAVWAAVLTGKLPLKNGVRSAGIYRASDAAVIDLLPNYCFAHVLVSFGFLTEEPHTSATLRTRALWSLLSTHGFSVGAVGWPLSEPAPVVRGYIVSNAYLPLGQMATAAVDSPTLYPPEVQPDVVRAIEAAATDTEGEEAVFAASLEARHQMPGYADRVYDRIAGELARTHLPQVTLTRYQSLDPIGHYFLRYATPAAFGDVVDDEHRARGPILERHYALIDDAIGREIAGLGPGDLLLVVSGFGMEPMPFGKRMIERMIGDREVNGTHDGAPDGFLLAYGASVARGRLIARASVVDVTPTILYFLGLPVGRDMDGYARTDIFQRSFTDERPIAFIPTYDR